MNRTLWPAFLIATSGVIFAWYLLLNCDSAWHLAAAELLLEGRRFGIDLFEINTPLTTYFAIAPVWLAHVTGLSSIDWFFGLSALAIISCVGLSLAMLHRMDDRYIAFGLAYVLMFLPSLYASYGQREHLMVALCTPYFVACMLYLERLNYRHSATAALLAGIGFCIKPHFTLLFIAAEFSLIISTRSLAPLRRRELWIILFVMSLYYFGLLLWEQGYVQSFLLLAPLYHAMYRPWDLHFLLPALIFSYVALILRYRARSRPDALLWLCLCVAALIIYIVARTGFNYQSFPLLAFTALAGAFILRVSRWRYGFILLHALLAYSVSATPSLLAERNTVLALSETIRTYAKGETAVILSNNNYMAFPAVVYSGARWGASLPALYYLDGYLRGQRQENKKAESFFTSAIQADLAKKPKLIAINTRISSVDYALYFGLPKGYERKDNIAGYDIYVRQLP